MLTIKPEIKEKITKNKVQDDDRKTSKGDHAPT